MIAILIWVIVIGVIYSLFKKWYKQRENFRSISGIPETMSGTPIAEKIWSEFINDGISHRPLVQRYLKTVARIFAIIHDIKINKAHMTDGISQGVYDERHPLDLVRMSGWGYMSNSLLSQQIRDWRIGVTGEMNQIIESSGFNNDKILYYRSLNEDLLNHIASQMNKYTKTFEKTVTINPIVNVQ